MGLKASQVAVAWIGSNQGANRYAGHPDVSEEAVMQAATQAGHRRAIALGIRSAVFFQHDTGADMPLLRSLANQADAWLKKMRKEEGCTTLITVSLHSDYTASAKVEGIMPIVYSQATLAKGQAIADRMSAALQYQIRAGYAQPGLIVLNGTIGDAYLFECGEHGTVGEADKLIHIQNSIGIVAVDSIVAVYGIEGTYPAPVVVPGEKGTVVAAQDVPIETLPGLFEGDADKHMHGDGNITRAQVGIVFKRYHDLYVAPILRGVTALTERIETLEALPKA